MNLILIRLFYLSICLILLASCLCPSTNCQTNEIKVDPAKKYDEIIDLNAVDVSIDSLTLLLPKLDSSLYPNWHTATEPLIWKAEDPTTNNFLSVPQELLSELGIEKVLKQSYKNENHLVEILIYKFMNFASAYSAFTVLHDGEITKLKVGKNASESKRLVNFWKGDYFIDIHTASEDNPTAKEFIILASQEVSKNIADEQLPPVVAIQLPALNRLQGSEKYCLGPVCFAKFLSFTEFDPAAFNLGESGGVIQAKYQLSDNPKDKEVVTLLLTRYLKKETAQNVFDLLVENFKKKKTENKDIEIDVDTNDRVVKIKKKKDDFTVLKQKGNLLAIAYEVKNKKSGERIIELVPWPIEITKQTLHSNE